VTAAGGRAVRGARAALWAWAATAAACAGPSLPAQSRGADSAAQATAQATPAAAPPRELRASACRPCTLAIAPGDPVWRVEVAAESANGGRAVRALRVVRNGWAPVMLPVSPPAALEVGGDFVVGVTALGPRRTPALFFTADLGVADARSAYWLVPAPGRAVALGHHPRLVTVAGGRVCAYERGGGGGLLSTRTEFRLDGDTLRPVRRQRVEASGRGDGALVLVRRTWDTAGRSRERRGALSVAAAERLARDEGPCPAPWSAGREE